MKIKYQIKITTDFEKSAEIENDEFIPIEHLENGRRMITAFIGKCDLKRRKY